MKKIKMHSSVELDKGEYSFVKGWVYEVDDATAKELIDRGDASEETCCGEEDSQPSRTKLPIVKHRPPMVHVGDRVVDADRNGGFADEREFWYSCAKLWNGTEHDRRLKALQDRSMRYFATKTAGSDEARFISNPAGGFIALPPGLIPDLLRVGIEQDPVGGRTRKVRMDRTTVSFPSLVDKNHSTSPIGGISVSYVEETAAIPVSQAQFEQVKLELHELCGAAFISDKLIRHSALAAADMLANLFRDAIRDKMQEMRLTGTGVGQPMGILSSDALITVSKEAGQPAATIDATNVLKMAQRCHNFQNAIWLANHNCYTYLRSMYIAIGTAGHLLWMDNMIEGQPAMLLGQPIHLTEYCETLGTAGDLILCDWSQYLDGVGVGPQMDSSMHVRFLEREQAIRVVFEHDGAPWWNAPMTPKNSSETRSPYVVLETRD